METKILIVDDEEAIRNVIKEYALNCGYQVKEAANGFEAEKVLKEEHFDLMILDIMMPKLDGFALLEKLDTASRIPTIILSARGEEFDKLTGFKQGIDDYLCKPFSPKELMARCAAILKRTKKEIKEYRYQDFVVNFLEHTVKIGNNTLAITPKEFEILTYFIENKKLAISRNQLLSKVWGYDFYGDDRTVDTHIKMLRNHLGEYRDLIETVRGIGYRFQDEKE